MMQLREIRGWWALPLLATAISAQAQQLSAGAATLNVPQSLDQILAAGNQSPFSGSVAAEPQRPGVVALSVDEAIDRGLKYNLGVVLSRQSSAQAKAARLSALSNLLPQIDASLRDSTNKINFSTVGIDAKAFGFPPAGYFGYADARLSMKADLFDWHAIENLRAAGADTKAATASLSTARETVTLAVAASYLLVVSAESRVEAATAELKTAEALHQLAQDREASGLNPNIDTLRARVELQARRQNLIEANNDLAKQRITLRRVLGLAIHQEIKLTSRIPYRPLPPVTEQNVLKLALAARPDYQVAEQQVKAAELRVKAAKAARYPTLGLTGDYGALGTHFTNSFATWTAGAAINVPVFEGGRIEAGIRQAEASLATSQAQRDDLRGRIEQDVADALLDVKSASEQVEVAQGTVQVAEQTLTESQDRFTAGVTNNIEVIQAQEAMATAHQQYISSLYAHNIAKVMLARAAGQAEQTLRQILGDSEAPAHP